HVDERPAAEFLAAHVVHDHRTVGAVLELALADRLGPGPELLVGRERALERDVLVLGRTRTLARADVAVLARVVLLDDLHLVAEPAGVGEEPRDAVVEGDREPRTD